MNIIKYLIPAVLRYKLRMLEKAIKYRWRKIIIQVPILFNRPLKIIVGAALTYQKGWYSTNQQWLDISNPHDWDSVFKGKQLITNILAEHVFEHLTDNDLKSALNLIYSHMKKNGTLRIAVPDGYNLDSSYLRNVGIKGIGPDAEDHKQLFNYDDLKKILMRSGFKVSLIEGYSANGKLTLNSWNETNGLVRRSRQNKENMKSEFMWSYPDENTSLIVDAIKL